MVNDLNDTQNRQPKNTLLKSKSLDNLSDTSTSLINNSTGITSPPPSYTKRPNKLQLSNFKLFTKTPFSPPKTTLQTSTLPFSSEQHPSLPNYSNQNLHPNDNLATPHDTLTNAPVTSNTDTPIKIYSQINYLFPSTILLNAISVCLPTLLLNTSLLLRKYHLSTSSKKYLVTIATPSSLGTLVEVHIPQVNSPPVILTVLKNSPFKVDKSIR